MFQKNVRKFVSLLLCACLTVGMFAGCGNKTASAEEAVLKDVASLDVNYLKTVDENAVDTPVLSRSNAGSPNGKTVGSGGAKLTADYVMIYNPKIYDENTASDVFTSNTDDVLSTGSLSSQIVTGSNRAGELEIPEREFTSIAQNDARLQTDTAEISRDGVRASAQDPTYKKGDKHEFWHQSADLNNRVKDSFTCAYVGSNCYVWSMNNSVSARQAETLGKEFDNKVYNKDVDAFGQPRFTENGGKINILMYPMDGGVCGFFTMADIYSSAELKASGINADVAGLNADHAIININTNLMGNNEEILYSTLAHELQHLICASDAFEYAYTPLMRTWLNEAMSAYAEELVYPGVKERDGQNAQFYLSENYRSGQSLYNFTSDLFLGNYGIVYLFEEYLCEKSGDDTMSGIHDYWRTARSSDMDEAKAIYNASSAKFVEEIDKSLTYTSALSSGLSKEEQWLSKMTLDFYLETLGDELADLDNPDYDAGYGDELRAIMLYTSAASATIEGGGRIVVATQNGTYQVPSDASDGLIYVTLDSKFKPTGFYDSTGKSLDGGSNAPAGNSGSTSSGNSSSGSNTSTQDGYINSSLDMVTYVPDTKTYSNVNKFTSKIDTLLTIAGANSTDNGKTGYSSSTSLDSMLEKGLDNDLPGFVIVVAEKLENSTIGFLNDYAAGGTVVAVIESGSPANGSWQVNVAYGQLGSLSDFDKELANDASLLSNLSSLLTNDIVDIANGDASRAWYQISPD